VPALGFPSGENAVSGRPARSRRKSSETPGAALRRSILDTYELSATEEATLNRAAALLDQLQRIEDELATQPVTTSGSRGQVVGNPLLDEQRRHAHTVALLLDALHIPMDDEMQGETLTTKRARRAAQVRWAREKGT
jgi:hypothetical protein